MAPPLTIKFSAFPSGSAIGGSDSLVGLQSGADVKWTFSQLATFIGTQTTALTVGGTTIASGTNGRILFDNSGILGEKAVSGSGNVALTTGPTFITPDL